LQFSTLNTSHHSPLAYVSILSLLRSAVPRVCRNKQKHYCAILYPDGANVTVQLNNSGAALCWQWGSPSHRTQ